jgi:hypothetical protein
VQLFNQKPNGTLTQLQLPLSKVILWPRFNTFYSLTTTKPLPRC